MKKKLLIALSVLMLMSIVFASGCSQNAKNMGYDYYADDLYKMVPKAEHEKRFPHGHQNKSGDDADRKCYYEKGTAAYFCQYWDEWDE